MVLLKRVYIRVSLIFFVISVIKPNRTPELLDKLKFVYFSFRNLILGITDLYFARSLFANGFPCAGYIVSASVEINRSHDFSKSATFSIQIISLLLLGRPFIAASPQKIILPRFRDIESEVCPGVDNISPSSRVSTSHLFSSVITISLSS